MYTDSTIEETRQAVSGDLIRGLSEKEALARLRRDGKNEMKSSRKKTVVESFLEQLNDPLIYVLIGAAAVSVFLKEISDAVIIGIVVFVNAVVGMIQEGKAQKALDSLKKLTSPHALVIRDGEKKEISAASVVVGDLVCLEAGCQVPADMRLVRSSNLKLEESALTGESLPIEKDAAFLVGKRGRTAIPLGDRRNMAYMSTIVTYGRGEGLVTATGMNTEIGKIAQMISESKEEMTPLQKRLGELGKVLSLLSLGLCAVLFLIAVVQNRNIMEMLITAISLAVAAVPEGLPAVVTICLALSVTRMVRVNTIVRRLPSVETLGAVSVVCSDKTGTLTQNRMTVEKCYLNLQEYGVKELPEGRLEKRSEKLPETWSEKLQRDFLYGIVLCNDAVLSVINGKEHSRIGDPTELALLDFAGKFGLYRQELEKDFPRCGELSFDSGRKMMTTCHRYIGGKNPGEGYPGRQYPGFQHSGFQYPGSQHPGGPEYIAYTKGAPEQVLRHCNRIKLQGQVVELNFRYRRQILKEVESMSGEALRTLAVAVNDSLSSARPQEENLIFLGLLGMKDPPRPEAAEAVETFRQAGVSTVMITGDHVDTAYAIAKQLQIVQGTDQCMTGAQIEQMQREAFLKRLDKVRVFARVSPAQKVEIVRGFQERGEIVAMTGDGVNDAPSLKAADIGISMGMTGTDVAKQASDMILTDDNFATIEKAIEEGRGVYENIRKSVIFLLSSNMGEIMTMFAAVLCGIASPLKSSHILWINLITDSLPALALGVDHNDGKSLMRHAPRRPEESLFARGGLACTCFYGLLIALISLTAFLMLPLTILRMEGILPDSFLQIFRPEIFSRVLSSLKEVLGNKEVLARAQTYAFTVLGMSQLFHAVGMRDVHRSFFRMNHLENKLMIAACAIGFALQFAVTEVPFLINAFGTSHLDGGEWMLLSILAAFPLLAHEILVLMISAASGRFKIRQGKLLISRKRRLMM